MLKLGWFSTGRGEGSRGLLQTTLDAIHRKELDARILFVFCNREPGEHEGSDLFQRLVRESGIPLVTLSSRRFARQQGKPFSQVRLEYDREVVRLLGGFAPDLCVLAGYMLITGPELCRRYPMLNLHPALPGGPSGTWQEVIWQLMAARASESGVMVHLVTEEVDQGPPITYCSFPIQSEPFDPHWRELKRRSVEEVKGQEGEEHPLFRLIRQEQMRRERPLMVETLKAFAQGRFRLVAGQVVDAHGQPVPTLCLNEEVERALRTS
ncbi:MAG: phosphoglycerate transporter [Dehalococcoidia bacterium]|nr:phosphoglycerate transporter [Dehalococcoidia bacterium]